MSENPCKPKDMTTEQWEKFCIDMAYVAIQKDPRRKEEIITYWKRAMKRI